MSRLIIWSSFMLILLGLFWTCANERAITGGPEDKQAPQVSFSTPLNESVKVDPSTEIFIKFDEQMKQSTFASALQIWPRPPGGYELKTGWTWLKVSFNEILEEDVTYLLTLDKGAQDLRGNGLESTYVLAFSTGEDLNSGQLRGVIHGSRDIKKNGDLYLYRQFDLPLSELRKLPADYIFQPDDDGRFELPYLAERSYMLFYHWDRNQNKLIDGDDYFGRPESASVLAQADSVENMHKIWPHLIPLDQIKLLGVSRLAETLIQIRTSRPVTNEALSKLDLHADSVKIPILGASKVEEDEYAIYLDIGLPLKDGDLMWVDNFQDTSGFKLHSDTLAFISDTSLDSLALEGFHVQWKDGNSKRFPGESSAIKIASNLPMTFMSDSAFQLVDVESDTLNIPGTLQPLTSMQWEFLPDTALGSGHGFKWQIETQYIQFPLNIHEPDSLIKGSLTTINADSLGSLLLMHMGVEVLECKLISKNVERFFSLKPGTAYFLDNLPAQTYSLSAYVDENADGHFNSGGLDPLIASESFWIYPDEIRIRARWETDLGIWRLHD